MIDLETKNLKTVVASCNAVSSLLDFNAKVTEKYSTIRIKGIVTYRKRLRFILKQYRHVNRFDMLSIKLQKAFNLSYFFAYYRRGLKLLLQRTRLSYFMVYKLGLRNQYNLLAIKALTYRSAYTVTTKKFEKVKVCFLWNLYFLSKIRWLQLENVCGSFDETTRGWQLSNEVKKNHPGTTLEFFASYSNLLDRVLRASQRFTLRRIRTYWASLQPYSWITLRSGVDSFWSEFKYNRRLDTYWMLEHDKFTLQYRIACHLPKGAWILRKKTRSISVWYFRVMVLRLYRHPALFNYNELEMLAVLTRYGFRRSLPFEKVVKSKVAWQADPTALNVKIILDTLIMQNLVKGPAVFTEMLITKCLMDTFNGNNNMSVCFRNDLFFRKPTFIANTVSRRWRLKKIN